MTVRWGDERQLPPPAPAIELPDDTPPPRRRRRFARCLLLTAGIGSAARWIAAGDASPVWALACVAGLAIAYLWSLARDGIVPNFERTRRGGVRLFFHRVGDRAPAPEHSPSPATGRRPNE